MEESQRIDETILKIMAVKIKYLMPIINEGQQKGVFINSISADDLVHVVMGAGVKTANEGAGYLEQLKSSYLTFNQYFK